ncbi:MAG: F0F1 ATP synthase subunit A [Gemmatales bacterium]|nr:F0F1 ATP synthase subunit A [Gemmatales bacterium]MDW7994508.1 F0F1 ATP synthase subunit A [Gemmatales bacterium]
MAHSPLEHSKDSAVWTFFDNRLTGKVELHLPAIPLPFREEPFQITKFMVIELLAALLLIVIYVPIARRARTGQPPKGYFWNCFEVILTFLRDEVAKPYIGEKDADRFVPYIWTVFLFILFCNLLGLVPFLGSPTGDLSVTGALALCSFLLIHGAAIRSQLAHGGHHAEHHGEGEHGHDAHHGRAEHSGTDVVPSVEKHAIALPHQGNRVPLLLAPLVGLYRYVLAHVPQTGIPLVVGWPLIVMIVAIEFLGHVIKASVLAVRLFANIFAGHTVLAFIMSFIVMAKNAHPVVWGVVTFGSILGVVALSLLEIFVAFLQAFIFTFLTALFLGFQLHMEH